jgi:hypothetical protein
MRRISAISLLLTGPGRLTAPEAFPLRRERVFGVRPIVARGCFPSHQATAFRC